MKNKTLETFEMKLGDFGLTKVLSQYSKISDPNGTAPYMSPEMHLGKRYNPKKSDIWYKKIGLCDRKMPSI